MKLAHIADLHCCREHAEEALASLRFFAEHIKTSPVDLVCIAGDVWDASMLNTEASGFNRFVDAIREIADLAPVAMICGTPSHDTDGSLEVFRKIKCTHGITLLEPGQAYFLEHINTIPAITTDPLCGLYGRTAAILFGIPEPRKKYLLAGEASGKDETEEAVRDAMHRLCFHLAAKRREYPDVPCVVLYHGDVAGSTLQNDQAVERGTGIAITADDLNDIGADYYALGHIHKPQQVGTLPAYYAGSIYPKNFGETHQAGFNVVNLPPYLGIDGKVEGNSTVARVDFPHPQNLKIETSDPLSYETPAGGIAGKRVWLEITCSKEQRALINTDGELAELREGGAVEGSRVTANELPVETMRAAEIAGAPTPERKFEIWAENAQQNIQPFHDKIFTKINRLAEDLRQESGAVSGEWELISARLRGAVGIQRGIGKEEITVNFADYEPGLIALTGANGKGKTTLIENCHPYPQLFTRKGKLQDHFCLRDSFREVVYRNRRGDQALRFLIQIDGQNKSGACKYFVFRNLDAEGTWTPVHGVDGNLKPYEEYVQSVFGPPELYLRTAHTSQRPTKNLPDLTEATAGEKKALFAELAGIDYLQRFAEAALERSKAEEGRAHDAELQAGMLERTAAERPAVEREIGGRRETLAADAKTLGELTEKGREARAEAERLEAEAAKEKEREQRETALDKEINNIEEKLTEGQEEVQAWQKLAENRAAYEEKAQLWEHYAATISAETGVKQRILEENLRKEREFSQKQQEYQQTAREMEQEKQRVSDSLRDIEKKLADGESKIKLLEQDARDFKTACPTCGQELPPDKRRELTGRRDQARAEIEDRQKEITGFQTDINDRKGTIKQITGMLAALAFDEPRPEEPEPFDDTALREAQAAQGEINITEAREALARAGEARARIEVCARNLEELRQAREEKKRERASIAASANPAIIRELEKAREEHADLTRRYTDIREAIARTEAELKAREDKLAAIAAAEEQMKTHRKVLEEARAEGLQWDLIARGFGRDGIQALELDALAPGIAETANRILASAYGERFRIEIRTTRMGGAGKKTRQIEDFLIYVIDAEDGEAVLLDDKSGGEAVWIKRAIYDAFAAIRKRNTGFAFLTCFQDEADGALDSAAKTAYCRMLDAAHAESGLRHTVIITHSEEVKAMIPQKIDMEDL